ncbi:hypothetical protein ACP70R_012143 [Stipagrostis hirtigluma subsp. patula]
MDYWLHRYNETWCSHIIGNYSTVHQPIKEEDNMTLTALVFTVVIMMGLSSAFFTVALLSIIFGKQSRSLNLFFFVIDPYPIVRVMMHSSMVILLPLLSSIYDSGSRDGSRDTQVLLVLLWMLLLELIRKKVLAMVVPADGSSFTRGIRRFSIWDYTDETSRLLLIGYYIISNKPLTTKHRRLLAAFAALWLIIVLKLVQKVVTNWLAERSWHTARKPLLTAVYMQRVVDEHRRSSGDATYDVGMSGCKFVVMMDGQLLPQHGAGSSSDRRRLSTRDWGHGVGEVQKHELQGVHLIVDLNNEEKMVTVGKIWKLAAAESGGGKLFHGERGRRLQNMCLAFSLFKLLRRRFEHYPMAEVGTAMARRLMLRDLLTFQDQKEEDNNASGDVTLQDQKEKANAERLFQVLQLELDFLDDYYKAAMPLVMSGPILFFCSFALSMLCVPIYLVSILAILMVNKDAENLYCSLIMWSGPMHSNPIATNFLFLSLLVTLSLLVIVCIIESTEFWTLYILSNWFTVRLVSWYAQEQQAQPASTPKWRRKLGKLGCSVIRSVVPLRFKIFTLVQLLLFRSGNKINVKVASILKACGLTDSCCAVTSQSPLPDKAKKLILRSLKRIDLNDGLITLPQLRGLHMSGKTITEIILESHIATELLHLARGEHQRMPEEEKQDRKVAVTLSGYCMHLVASMPELLPDDDTWVSTLHDGVKSCLSKVPNRCCGILRVPNKRCAKQMLDYIKVKELEDPTAQAGVKLFMALEKSTAPPSVWKELARFWVQLVVYLAPSNDVQEHAKVLASSGSDIITCLWAFCTHAGITRKPLEPESQPA